MTRRARGRWGSRKIGSRSRSKRIRRIRKMIIKRKWEGEREELEKKDEE